MAGTKIPPAEVDSAHAAWSQSARRQWQTYRETVAPGVALDSLRAWARRHPMTVRTTFDNEHGPDFSDLFEEAPIIEGTPTDSARLRAYAMHLRDLMAAKDTLNIYRAHKPRFDDIQFSASKALDVIGRNWLAPDWRLEFQASDVALRKWSDGRIWEIYREDEVSRALRKQALFLAGEERLQTWHTVYVAEVNDSLRVVR